ncbi:MAG: response regulator, partial [Bdellovibrionales bacterium]|nr:response regulator [Bdellovibrionales bacterium]
MEPRILVVEDEAIVALDIEEELIKSGYQVTSVVDTGEDAIAAAEKEKPNLVLMDIVLSGDMDGVQAAAHIQDRYQLPVIYLTAHADEATLQKARVTTPYGYILKPFQESELKPAIDIALDRHKRDQARLASEGAATVNQRLFISEHLDISSAEEAFSQIQPLADFPEHIRTSLASSSQLRSLGEGESIIYENDPFLSAFLVISGRIILVKSSANGKELIVDFIPPADILPLTVSLEEKYAPFTARAQAPTKILQIPKTSLALALEQAPHLYRALSEHMAHRLRESFDMSRRLAHDRVEVRIATALLGLRNRLGLKSEPDEEFVLEVTRKELADLTG